MNPVITNNDSLKIPVLNPIFGDISLEAKGADTLAAGTVLAFVDADGTYQATVSTLAATNNAKAILPEEVVFAGAATVNTRAILGGEVNESKLVFDNGADTLDTVSAAGETFKVQLRDYGIVTVPGIAIDELDNQ